MKSGSRVVNRYSSMYEKTLPNRSLRCRMELHPASFARPRGHGRPRIHDLREILNAVFYVLKSGCQWRLLCHDFPRDGPPSTTISDDGVSTLRVRRSTVPSVNALGFARKRILSPVPASWIPSRSRAPEWAEKSAATPGARRSREEIMDSLPAHKPGRVRELIEERGCELLYLPGYSPDYNPIEEAFSKIKGILRRACARTREALLEALGEALSAVSLRDAWGFFEHAGYHSLGQRL